MLRSSVAFLAVLSMMSPPGQNEGVWWAGGIHQIKPSIQSHASGTLAHAAQDHHMINRIKLAVLSQSISQVDTHGHIELLYLQKKVPFFFQRWNLERKVHKVAPVGEGLYPPSPSELTSSIAHGFHAWWCTCPDVDTPQTLFRQNVQPKHARTCRKSPQMPRALNLKLDSKCQNPTTNALKTSQNRQ